MSAVLSLASNTTQTFVTIIFGATATVISGVTIYQGHRTWRMWQEHQRQQQAPDLEPGNHGSESLAPFSMMVIGQPVQEEAAPAPLKIESSMPSDIDARTPSAIDFEAPHHDQDHSARSDVDIGMPASTDVQVPHHDQDEPAPCNGDINAPSSMNFRITHQDQQNSAPFDRVDRDTESNPPARALW